VFPTDNFRLSYGSFVPVVVKGIQVQQVMIDTQKVQIDGLQAEIALLKQRLDRISEMLGQGINNRNDHTE